MKQKQGKTKFKETWREKISVEIIKKVNKTFDISMISGGRFNCFDVFMAALRKASPGIKAGTSGLMNLISGKNKGKQLTLRAPSTKST